MNRPSTIRIIAEKLDRGKVIDRHVISLHDPPYPAKHFFMRYGGKRSKKYETITITQLTRKLAIWFKEWTK